MKKIKELFKASYHELSSLISIIVLGMFGAISVIIGMFLTIMPVDTIKITFTFLPNEFIYYLLGPTVGAIFGAVVDLLNFIVNPNGTFFLGITLCNMLTGVIFGLMLYKKPVSIIRIFIATLIRVIFVDLLLITYCLTVMYGYNFLALLPMRALKNLIMLPIETILLFALIKGMEATGVLKVFRRRNA